MAVICKACDFGNPIAKGRRIWKPEGSGPSLRWERMDCCEGCYWFAVSNGIKQEQHDHWTGKKYLRWERICVGATINDVPVYEWVQR